MAALGSYGGIKQVRQNLIVWRSRCVQQVRRIVEDTMKNIHPVYNIKVCLCVRPCTNDHWWPADFND